MFFHGTEVKHKAANIAVLAIVVLGCLAIHQRFIAPMIHSHHKDAAKAKA